MPTEHFSYLLDEKRPSPAVQIMAAHYLPRQGEEPLIMVSSVSSGERTVAEWGLGRPGPSSFLAYYEAAPT